MLKTFKSISDAVAYCKENYKHLDAEALERELKERSICDLGGIIFVLDEHGILN